MEKKSFRLGRVDIEEERKDRKERERLHTADR